jgi:hypothetical protein
MSTSNMATIHTVLTMAAQEDKEIHQVNIKSAYLYAELREDIYMWPPSGYLKQREERKVLKLLRSLPGLKQAGFEWLEELAGMFLKMGFSWSKVDQVVYYKCHTDKHTIITISMDDMEVTSRHLCHITLFKDELKKYFEISDLGELSWLLGLKVE